MPAIGSHSTATNDGAWDGAANEARCPAAAGPLRASHAWYAGSNPDAKVSYRFIHHFVGANGSVGAASTVACSAGIAVLNGGRGGTTIPSGDRSGVYAHLARHLRDANREVPPLRNQPTDSEARDMTATPILASVIERKITPHVVEMRDDVRAQNGARPRKIFGYAAVFEKISRPLGGFQEIVGRSAFNKSRADGYPGVVARFNHDSNQLLGTTEARTLILTADDYGLEYEVDPPANLPLVRELIERGDVRRSSFAFRTIQDDWSTTDGGYPLRTLTEVQLVDVAPVVDPAYTATTAGVRGFVPEHDLEFGAVSAGYESLAVRCNCSLEEIQTAAEMDELRKFFVRTDQPAKPKPSTFGPSALARLMTLKKDDE